MLRQFRASDMNLKTLLIISAAASMHSPTTQAASENPLVSSVQNRLSLTMEQSEMQLTPPKHNMTEEQQARMLQAIKIGLRWAAGEITFEEVQWILGKPDGPIKRGIERVYRYEPVEATLEFAFDGA